MILCVVVFVMMFVCLGLGCWGQYLYGTWKYEAQRDVMEACYLWRTHTNYQEDKQDEIAMDLLQDVYDAGWINLDRLDLNDVDKRMALELGPWS